VRLRTEFLLVPALLVATSLGGYEWRSHNRMAWNARDLLLNPNRAGASIDPELRTFLETYGEKDLDTRAGTSYDPFVFFGTDEDSLEAKILTPWGGECFYKEAQCFAWCSLDHFSPPLLAPFVGQDALAHARWYFEWAIRFYKAGICRPSKKAIFHRWAARALGHAIHLVQDMGSPQHVAPENHAPTWAGGDGRSFHEQWTLKLWELGTTTTYTRKDGTSFPVGGFEKYAAAASSPVHGTLLSIMRALATESKDFSALSPYHPGRKLELNGSQAAPGLLQVLAPSGLTARNLRWVDLPQLPYADDTLESF
jgi:hypothetical protein